MTLPLAPLTVLDFADEPLVLASRLLGDLGATVIRVEPAAANGVRSRPPFVNGVAGSERSLAHIRYNAGKQSLALDLERPEAWRIVERLVARADVAIAPMEPSERVAEFFDPANIMRVAPTLGVVEAVLRRSGPRQAVADIVGTAAGGLLYLNGYPEDAPNHPAGQLAYKQTSFAAALGAMSLVLAGQASQSGGRIVVSMQEAMMWTTIQSANENYWHWHKSVPVRRGLANLGGQTIFETRDARWVSLYQHPPAWPAYAKWVEEALGETRFSQPEWDDGYYRFEHNAEITEVSTRLCRSMDREALVEEAQRRSILVVPVQTVTDIARDPHLRARGFFQKVWHEQLGQELEVMRPPFISSRYRASARPAPALGEHSRTILTDVAGYSADEVEQFIASGLVAAPERREKGAGR